MSLDNSEFSRLNQWISQSISLSESSSFMKIFRNLKMDQTKPLSHHILKESYEIAQHCVDKMKALEHRMANNTLKNYTLEAIKLKFLSLLHLQILALDQKIYLVYITLSNSIKKFRDSEKRLKI